MLVSVSLHQAVRRRRQGAACGRRRVHGAAAGAEPVRLGLHPRGPGCCVRAAVGPRQPRSGGAHTEQPDFCSSSNRPGLCSSLCWWQHAMSMTTAVALTTQRVDSTTRHLSRHLSRHLASHLSHRPSSPACIRICMLQSNVLILDNISICDQLWHLAPGGLGVAGCGGVVAERVPLDVLAAAGRPRRRGHDAPHCALPPFALHPERPRRRAAAASRGGTPHPSRPQTYPPGCRSVSRRRALPHSWGCPVLCEWQWPNRNAIHQGFQPTQTRPSRDIPNSTPF